MSLKRELIYIDGKDETDRIEFCSYRGDKYIIVFKNHSTEYQYSDNRIKIIKTAINKHLSNIYDEGELNKEATISILEIVQKEGTRDTRRNVEFYNLDAIISVGYRVNPSRATQFRIWLRKR